MPSLNHIHTYIRCIGRVTKSNKDSKFIGYFKCKHPQCSHYIKAELILGKQSICNRCGEEFTLPLAIRFLGMKPHCKKCTKGSHRNPVKVIKAVEADILDELMIED